MRLRDDKTPIIFKNPCCEVCHEGYCDMATVSSVHAVNEQTLGVPYPYTDERSGWWLASERPWTRDGRNARAGGGASLARKARCAHARCALSAGQKGWRAREMSRLWPTSRSASTPPASATMTAPAATFIMCSCSSWPMGVRPSPGMCAQARVLLRL